MVHDNSCVNEIKKVAATATKTNPIYVGSLLGKLNYSEATIIESVKYLIDSNVLDARTLPIDGAFEAAIYGLR